MLLVALGCWWYAAAAELPDGGFDEVTISHQGPVSWSLPLYLAEKFGYFEEMQIKPTFLVVRTRERLLPFPAYIPFVFSDTQIL